MLVREELIAQYRRMIVGGLFGGLSIKMYLKNIETICRAHKAKSLLDYGCGAAGAWKDGTLAKRLGIDVVALYDPAVYEFAERPQRTFDVVVCVDVLEHIPEQDVPDVIRDLFALADKFVFAAVCCRPSKRKFSDGTNVHVTIRPMSWWRAIFSELSGDKRYLLVQSP